MVTHIVLILTERVPVKSGGDSWTIRALAVMAICTVLAAVSAAYAK